MKKHLFKILLYSGFMFFMTVMTYVQITYDSAQHLALISNTSLSEMSGIASSSNTPEIFGYIMNREMAQEFC